MKIKNTSIKKVKIEGNYEDFKDFYDINKKLIYMSIIDIFHEFKKNNEKTSILNISAKIRGLEWDTEFNFNRDQTIILKRDIIPYFERNEEYEICSEINNLYKDLTL